MKVGLQVGHSLHEIFQVEAQLQQAMLKNDLQALDLLLHTDLIFTTQTGSILGKQDDLTSHASGELRLLDLELIDPLTRIYGETAVVVVKARLKGTFQETAFSGDFRYTRVWLFQNERWQVITGHFGEII